MQDFLEEEEQAEINRIINMAGTTLDPGMMPGGVGAHTFLNDTMLSASEQAEVDRSSSQPVDNQSQITMGSRDNLLAGATRGDGANSVSTGFMGLGGNKKVYGGGKRNTIQRNPSTN
jgi:hypothetical protein